MPDKAELKLEHLAPYLPYALKCIVGKEKVLLIGLDTEAEYWIIWKKLAASNQGCSYPSKNFKPILRPLSDLTKEIEQLEEFCPYTEDERYNSEGEDGFEIILENFASMNTRLQTNWFSYEFYEKLFKIHFDVFGLIEKGLAIDVNTLSVNPYK